jgi:hypothetical protein
MKKRDERIFRGSTNTLGVPLVSWVIRYAVVLAASAAFALVLSRVPSAEDNGLHAAVFSVFRHETATVDERNIVDAMIRLPLRLDIAKVDLGPSVLSVDLMLKQPEQHAYVFPDLFEITDFFLRRTGNVEQIFVRVLRPASARDGTAKPSLLVAVDARREDIGGAAPRLGTWTADSMEQFVRSHFRLTETARWNELRMDDARNAKN